MLDAAAGCHLLTVKLLLRLKVSGGLRVDEQKGRSVGRLVVYKASAH
jgi:hypothetical protein